MDTLLDFCAAILLLTGGLVVSVAWIILWVLLSIEIVDNWREANHQKGEEDVQ